MAKSISIGCVLALGIAMVPMSRAAELQTGHVIDARNLDDALQHSFQGHALADLIPETVRLLIRDHNLQMPLKPIEKLPIADEYYQATAKFSGQVEFDPQTKLINNYVAGQPFPDINPDDPHAGYKVMYNNFYYFSMSGPSLDGDYDQLLVDDKNGLEQHQTWRFTNFPMRGRSIEPHILGDGDLAKKEVVFAKKPYDIKGLGVLTYRYADGRLDDSWAYIKSIRRVRRISSAAWIDPVGGSDYLYDDINGFNAHPVWYEDFKYLGRKHILGMQMEKQQRFPDAASKNEEFPYIDLSNPPHWNPLQEWGPLEVDVVEAIPPEIHPYSKKIYYFSTWYPGYVLLVEIYDKRGELWKVDLLAPGVGQDPDGRWWVSKFLAHMIDIKNMHATIAVGWDVDPNYLDEATMSPDALKKAAR